MRKGKSSKEKKNKEVKYLVRLQSNLLLSTDKTKNTFELY